MIITKYYGCQCLRRSVYDREYRDTGVSIENNTNLGVYYRYYNSFTTKNLCYDRDIR